MTRPSATTPRRRVSEKTSRFTESVICEPTREAATHGAANLLQGFPDFTAPAEIKAAAMRAIASGVNQYVSKNFAPEIANL